MIFSMNIFSLCPEASSRVDILRLLSLFLHHSCYCDIPENIFRPEDTPHFTIPLEWLVRNFPKLSLIRSLMSWMRLTIRFARIKVNSVQSVNTLGFRLYSLNYTYLSFAFPFHTVLIITMQIPSVLCFASRLNYLIISEAFLWIEHTLDFLLSESIESRCESRTLSSFGRFFKCRSGERDDFLSVIFRLASFYKIIIKNLEHGSSVNKI